MNPERRAPGPRLPRPGEVLTIQENDYRFGLGELVLRVTRVGAVLQQEDGEWLTVVGMELGRNGIQFSEREVLVRLSSLVKRGGRP